MYLANSLPFAVLAAVLLSEQTRKKLQAEKEAEDLRKSKELAERTAEKL